MTNYDAVGLAEGFIKGTEKQKIEAWQYLVDTGLAFRLQGFFGRKATKLINAGIIHPPGRPKDEGDKTTKA